MYKSTLPSVVKVNDGVHTAPSLIHMV